MSNNGKYGEHIFQELMTQKGYQVQNVSKNPEYYYKGDFIITSPTTGAVKLFEVKWDSKIQDTKNLYLELSNNNSKDGEGWWKFCKADYLAYGNANTHTFYIFNLLELHQRVEELPKEYGQCGSDSVGYLVNLKDVEDLYKVERYYFQ